MTPRRLTLVAGASPGPLEGAVAELERTFCEWQPTIVEWLAEVEARTPDGDVPAVHAVHEQAAFIRVGLSCICDAIGELASHVTTLDRDVGRQR